MERISIKIGNQPYYGRYIVDGGVVMVSSPYGSRITEVVGSLPALTARRLLREMVADYLSKVQSIVLIKAGVTGRSTKVFPVSSTHIPSPTSPRQSPVT